MNKLHKLIREELAKALKENEDDIYDPTNDWERDAFFNNNRPDEPQEDDCFIEDVVRGGYDVSCGGKFVTHVDGFESAINAINDWQKKNKWWSDIWFVSDHGNISLIDNKGKFIEGVIKEAYKLREPFHTPEVLKRLEEAEDLLAETLNENMKPALTLKISNFLKTRLPHITWGK